MIFQLPATTLRFLRSNTYVASNIDINDRFALSEQISFARSNNVLLLNSFETASEKVDQAYLSHGLIFSGKRDGKVLRALLTLGLNDASTDYILSFSLQK